MENSERACKKVGTIEIKSGYVVASDPCYPYGIWCAAEIKVKNGLYDVIILETDTGWAEEDGEYYALMIDFLGNNDEE